MALGQLPEFSGIRLVLRALTSRQTPELLSHGRGVAPCPEASRVPCCQSPGSRQGLVQLQGHRADEQRLCRGCEGLGMPSPVLLHFSTRRAQPHTATKPALNILEEKRQEGRAPSAASRGTHTDQSA